jgi:hypothetical protein
MGIVHFSNVPLKGYAKHFLQWKMVVKWMHEHMLKVFFQGD